MRILHLEDNDDDAELVRRQIAAEWPECELRRVATRFAFVAELNLRAYDLILSDMTVSGFTGVEALALARARHPDTPFVFLSGTIGEERAVEILRAGADDYVLKDRMQRLNAAIARAIREAEERVRRRAAESRMRELAECLNHAREAVAMIDLEGRITFWNHGAEQLTGWPAEMATGRAAHHLLDPATRQALEPACAALRTAGEWSGECRLRQRDGSQRWVELRIASLRDSAGKPRARWVLGTDIGERREAERQIREQAEMLNQAREAIFSMDLENRVITWNAGAERLYGWRSDEVIGRRTEELFDVTASSGLQAAREATLTHGQWCGELQMQTRSGEHLVVESRQTLIRDENGEPRARLCINTDITDRKRLEEQFLRAQRMENIGLLAAGIAHDLNNMLAPILLVGPLLRDHVRDPGALVLLETLEKSAERGVNLVRQVLAFAHGASSEPRALQVKHVLREVTAMIAGTFPKSIRLEEQIPGDLWTVKGNATQIHQVLLNLTVNARDAMPEGGTLSVRAYNQLLDLAQARAIDGARPGAFLVIEVGDTGTGIAPEHLARIWEPFFTTKPAGLGTGLGLSTVRQIVQSHSGFVQVHTQVGRGTRFQVFLPVEAEQWAEARTAPAAPRREGKGEMILVVDDEQHVRETTQAILTWAGYRVLLAADGVEAARVFAQRAAEIRLIVTDVHMPNLDGTMLGRVLRRINPSVRMLMMSGMSADGGESAEAAGVGERADEFLPKPFRAEALLERVHALLSRAEKRDARSEAGSAAQ